MQSANAAFQQHLVDERARIDAYNQQQAAAYSSNRVIVEGRNGTFTTSDASGRTVTVDSATAAMLQSNPGLTVTTRNRRGGGFQVYDRSGNIMASDNTAGQFLTPRVEYVPPDMSGMWQRHFDSAMDLNSAREIGRIGNPYKAFYE